MKKKSSELKKQARKALAGNYGLCIGAFFVVGVVAVIIMLIYRGVAGVNQISVAPQYNQLLSFQGAAKFLAANITLQLIYSVVNLFSYGLDKIYMNICQGKLRKFGDILYAFGNHPMKFIGLYLCMALVLGLIGVPMMIVNYAASATGFIPVLVGAQLIIGVVTIAAVLVVTLQLSQASYLLLDDPQMGVFQSLKMSTRLMKGNKRRLFYVELSFAGMLILGIISCGIGLLWVTPYIGCTYVCFYEDLKKTAGLSNVGEMIGNAYTVPYEDVTGR